MYIALKLSYQVACTSSLQCNDNVLLTCPSSSGQCNCPTTSLAKYCDCPSGTSFKFIIRRKKLKIKKYFLRLLLELYYFSLW